MKKEKVLLLGCGWMGARADMDKKNITTYAKALSKFSCSDIFVYDINYENLQRVVNLYGYNRVNDLNQIELTDFTLGIIASPTDQHVIHLEILLRNNIPQIICEKPVCLSYSGLEKIKNAYNASSSRVFVNYGRTYSLTFRKVRDIISREYKQETATNVSITYQRGIINNCSHAVNLCEMLLQRRFCVSEFQISSKSYDLIPNDPTLSGFGSWFDTTFVLNGIKDTNFPLMDILICYPSGYINIFDCASKIKIYKAKVGSEFQNLEKCFGLYEDQQEENIICNVIEESFEEVTMDNKYVELGSVLSMTKELLGLIEK